MAVQDSENPSHPGARLSPGDAAFERLRQREALRSRDESAATPEIESAMFIGPPVDPATTPAAPAAGCGHRQAARIAEARRHRRRRRQASRRADACGRATPASRSAGEPADRILAMAAAFGIEAASPASLDEAPVAIEPPPRSRRRTRPIPPRPWRPKSPILFRPPPPLRPPPSLRPAPRTVARRRPRPPTPPPPGWKRRCSTSSSRWRRRWSRTPRARPPRLPRAAPLRPATGAPGTPVPEAPPQRSVFAPDPVRQRTYVDLRNPAPVPEADASDNPPWRKYLDERPRRETTSRSVPHRPPASPAGTGRRRWPPRSMTARPRSRSAGAASAP